MANNPENKTNRTSVFSGKDETRYSVPLNSIKGYALSRKALVQRERSTADGYSTIKNKMQEMYRPKGSK